MSMNHCFVRFSFYIFHNNRWYIVILSCISRNNYWTRLWVYESLCEHIVSHHANIVFEGFFFIPFFLFFDYCDFIFSFVENISLLETENIDCIRIFFLLQQQTRTTLRLKCKRKPLNFHIKNAKLNTITIFEDKVFVCLR